MYEREKEILAASGLDVAFGIEQAKRRIALGIRPWTAHDILQMAFNGPHNRAERVTPLAVLAFRTLYWNEPWIKARGKHV